VTRTARRASLGLGLALACGLMPFVWLCLVLLHHTPPASMLTEQIVACASFSIAIFTLTAVGLAFFWAVRDSRLHWSSAALLFLAVAIVSLFVPCLLMTASRAFWPYNFRGDSGFAVSLAPFGMAMFAVPAVIAFAVSFIFARWRSHVEPSQPPAISGGSQFRLSGGGMLAIATVVACAFLIASFLAIRSHWAQANDPGGHVKLGTKLNEQGRLSEAMAQYRMALVAKPDNAEAHYRYGVALAALGRQGEAADHFRRAIMLKSDHAEAHYHLGLVLAARGQQAEAILEYRQALVLKPDYKEARQRLDKAIQGKDKGR
jgi:hypothetical protein